MANENIFTGVIDLDGGIYEMNGYRKGRPVGVDLQREQEYKDQAAEMQEIIDNYYGKLVELGVIVPPKTAEELAAEQMRLAQEQAAQQAEINLKLLAAIEGLQAQIGELKGGEGSVDDFGHGDGPVIKQNRQGGGGSGAKSGRDSRGRFTGEEAAS